MNDITDAEITEILMGSIAGRDDVIRMQETQIEAHIQRIDVLTADMEALKLRNDALGVKLDQFKKLLQEQKSVSNKGFVQKMFGRFV